MYCTGCIYDVCTVLVVYAVCTVLLVYAVCPVLVVYMHYVLYWLYICIMYCTAAMI